MDTKAVSNNKIGDFLRKECKKRGLSQRALSINSGLSPGTVHNIIQRKYQPTLLSLNCIADYLEIDRAFLWRLAGLIKESDASVECDTPDDPTIKMHIERLSRLPEDAREQIFSLCDTLLSFFEREQKTPVAAHVKATETGRPDNGGSSA